MTKASGVAIVGCDTFVAFPPASPPGVVVFGKNSDRPAGEGQSIRRYPSAQYPDQSPQLQCTYITIPQARETHAVLLSQIDWMWGAEMGANEHHVVIGNEAVWTKEPTTAHGNQDTALLGMDLVRLGLERGKTARQALDVITSLLETYGQAGPCAQDDPSFTYHNSYLIVDPSEAWVLETAGIQWVAELVTAGVRNISNCLSIGTKYDLASKGLEEYASHKGYWNNNRGDVHFAKAFSCDGDDGEDDPRFCGGRTLLRQHDGRGSLDHTEMMKILRHHGHGICMHGGFETTSAWISELYVSQKARQTHGGGKPARHWMTGKPYPCKTSFLEQSIVQDG